MKIEDTKRFEEPYKDEHVEVDRRFHKFIEADVPSANTLVREIIADLDKTTFGIRWWSIPDQERILISDYLYQCAYSIETNLVESKLHILEWQDARERQNTRLSDVVSLTGEGLKAKMPPAIAPIDDLPSKLDDMHVCGFFQAIGSSLDCLAAVVIGVLGLPTGLRRCDLRRMETALSNLPTGSEQLLLDFRDYYETVKNSSGPDDWLNWTNLFRNMLIHRGRRIINHSLIQRPNPLYDASGKTIIRTDATTHLPVDPDRSDVEAWVRSPQITLTEDAEVTINGVFKSCRKFEEEICARLVSIWEERKQNPGLIVQPLSQWDTSIRTSDFEGYHHRQEREEGDGMGLANRVLLHRMISASVMDQQRSLWAGSPYVS